MKALILCNDFPPINSIGAERPYSWFLYFKENGIDPVVVTKNWISSDYSTFNKVSKKTIIKQTKNGTLIKTGFRLTPSLFWRVIFKNKFSTVRKGLSLIDKIFSFIVMFFDNNRGLYFEADKYLANQSVDIVITTGEPFILFRYGYLLKKK